MNKVIDSGRISNCIVSLVIYLSARRMLLHFVFRPSLEYGNEIWDCNKSQAIALQSVTIGCARKMLGCSSETCNKAIRWDMVSDTLRSCRDKAKLKGWYKLLSMPDDKQIFCGI